jgi:hypothetical protein
MRRKLHYQVGKGHPSLRALEIAGLSMGSGSAVKADAMILGGSLILVFKKAPTEVQLLKPLRSLDANLTRQSWHGEQITLEFLTPCTKFTA